MTQIFLSNIIQNDPGVIVGPITSLLGVVFNFIFNIVYNMSPAQSLGVSIIMLTILVRIIMLPLALKSQKSMQAMQKLTPEMEKIKAKYGEIPKGDTEKQALMNQEIQQLYAKHKVNPLAGCLPLFIQMPIFIALNFLMNNTYRYVHTIGDIYNAMAEKIMEIPNYATTLSEIATPMLQRGAENFDINTIDSVLKVVNKMSTESWTTLTTALPELQQPVTAFFEQKATIESFVGIDLTNAAGWAFPGILIPILVAFTTFLTSFVSMRQSSSAQNAQMKSMMYVMPIMMFFMTVGLTAGVGVYWITSSIFQIGQQVFLNIKSKADEKFEIEEKHDEKNAKKPLPQLEQPKEKHANRYGHPNRSMNKGKGHKDYQDFNFKNTHKKNSPKDGKK
ncbi:MAG: YidC/Oxa1 family membrane protein insertase [Lachnospirales bacterium]